MKKCSLLLICVAFVTNLVAQTPTLVSPTNNSTNLAIRPTLDWNAVTGAKSYLYKIDTTKNFNSPFLVEGKTADAASNLLAYNLHYGATYYWKIAAVNSVDTSAWSSIWKFSTAKAVTLASPSNNATNQVIRPTLDWDANSGTSQYLYKIDTSKNFNSSFLVEGITADASSNLLAYKLHYGATYYWKIAAVNNVDTSDWSAIWKFTTANTVTLASPSNNAINQVIRPTLDWNANSGTSQYLYKIDTSKNFNSSFLVEGITADASSNLLAYKLHYGAAYYWKIAAVNNVDTSDWSAIWKFTTSSSVNLVAPSNQAINVGTQVNIDWAANSGTDNYIYQLDTSPNFSSSLVYEKNTGNAASNVTVSNLLFDQVYYWRVKAVNSVDTSEWSTVWSFNTGGLSTNVIETNSTIALYPNPFEDNLTLTFTDLPKNYSIKIFDACGKLVHAENINSVVHSMQLSKLNEGLYMVQVCSDNVEQKIFRVVKK